MLATSNRSLAIEQLSVLKNPADLAALSEVLIDCVEGGASVSFMSPLSRSKADAYWQGVIEAAALGERILLVTRNAGGRIMGTVQLVLAQAENQPHRGDISKLLVLRSARCRGVATTLMQAAEECALHAGKTLLVLDTATGSDAEHLYQSWGWSLCGRIPGYALWPHGSVCSTTIFYKTLS
jgi:GNAT superfamily N-acetyltransferase